MKVTDLLYRKTRPKKLRESRQIEIKIDVASDENQFQNPAIRELTKLLLEIGPELEKYLRSDEAALMNQIAGFGLRDSYYRPTQAVESFARYLQAKTELSRALACPEPEPA
jgi:hypothetical protein